MVTRLWSYHTTNFTQPFANGMLANGKRLVASGHTGYPVCSKHPSPRFWMPGLYIWLEQVKCLLDKVLPRWQFCYQWKTCRLVIQAMMTMMTGLDNNCGASRMLSCKYLGLLSASNDNSLGYETSYLPACLQTFVASKYSVFIYLSWELSSHFFYVANLKENRDKVTITQVNSHSKLKTS